VEYDNRKSLTIEDLLPDAHVPFNIPIPFQFTGEKWNKNGIKTVTSS
jgi:hypothetical protein